MYKEITLAIIALNAQKNIGKTLQSLCKFKNIVVIDNNSNDKTHAIAKKYTKNVFKTSTYGLAELRNYALTKVKTKWVLFIDTDETIDSKNLKILLKEWTQLKNNYDGFWLARRNYYNNEKESYLKHGLFYPDFQLRLFKSHYRFIYNVHEIANVPLLATRYLNNVEIYHYPNRKKYFSLQGIFLFDNFIHIYSRALLKKNIVILLFMGVMKFLNLFLISLTRGKGLLDGLKGIIAAFVFSFQILCIYWYAAYRKIKKN